MLDDMSPPESPGGVAAVEVVAPPVVAMDGDEASRLRVLLEAIQEATTRLEQEVATAVASRAKA